MQHSNDFAQLCNDIRTRVPEVTIQEVLHALQEKEPFYLIDVRETDEFERGAVPGASHISKGWIEAKIHHLVTDKTAKVVLYCGGGNRSLLAADNLLKMGYKHVYSMQGGYRAWQAEKQMTDIR